MVSKCTCAGDEAVDIVAVLSILPEIDVAMVEDVSPDIQVVEALG